MIFLIFLLFSVLFREGETVTYKPTDVILINCGTTSNTHTDGRTWTPEEMIVMASNLANTSFTATAFRSQLDNRRDVPYNTVRIFRSSFTYSFSVSPGWKFLRLHFYPTRYGSDLDAVKSNFSVTVNGFTLLKDFNPALTTNASGLPSTYLFKEYIVPVSSGHNKTLNLTLTPSPNSLAFLNGVEIVSMPDRLYTKGGFDNNITDVGTNSDFKIDNQTVLETVYRLNVGGYMIHDVNETGMFRRWVRDDDFLHVEDSTITKMSNKINYTDETPSYVTTEEVYNTGRSSKGTAKGVNLTWFFPVDAGFNYLVRLHFCEATFQITKPGQRLFNIIIGNQIAKSATDVVDLSGGPNIPLYLDFNTLLASDTSKSVGRPDLRVDLYPSEYSFDAFLNGIEILKLNDSKGNLAGAYVHPKIISEGGKMKKLHILMIVFGIAIGLATFIVVFMLTKRRKRKDNIVAMFKELLKEYTYAY